MLEPGLLLASPAGLAYSGRSSHHEEPQNADSYCIID
jgi:hypothetical protein